MGTEITGKQVRDGSIDRNDLNTGTSGLAVIRKILATAGITIQSYTGADSGTGDVTIAADLTFLNTKYFAKADSVAQNTVLAGPTSGSGPATFRTLTAGDVPTPNLQQVTDTGGSTTANVMLGGQLTIGSTAAPRTFAADAAFLPGYTPNTEIITGNSSGVAYSEAVVIRHNGSGGTGSLQRELGLIFKMNADTNASESQKMGAIMMRSLNGFSNNPDMLFFTRNAERMRIFDNGNIAIGTTSTISKMEVSKGSVSSADPIISASQNGGSISFQNGTANIADFVPVVRGANSGTNTSWGLSLIGQGQNSYSQGAVVVRGYNAAGDGAPTGKLFSVQAYTTETVSIWDNGNLKLTGGNVVLRDSNLKVVKNATSFRVSTASTGSIVFKHAPTAPGAMITMKLKGYQYNSGRTFEITLSFYFNGTTTISPNGKSAYLIASSVMPGFADVYAGFDVDGNLSVIIGEVTTAWSTYLHLWIDEVTTSHTSYDNATWESGWSVSLVSDLTGYTAVTALGLKTIANQDWVTSVLPAVNNGNLSLSTSGIATGSASFTANQAGNSTFTVNVPGTNISDSSNAGEILSSTGTGSTLKSLARINMADANSALNAGAWHFSNTTGSTGYPSSTGSGIDVRRSGADFSGAWGLFASNTGTSNNQLYMRTNASASAMNAWTIIADRDWVATQINNGALTLSTSGIATGSATFTANQSTAANFTVNVPGTNVGGLAAEWGRVTSSTGTNGYVYGIRSFGGGAVNGDSINSTEFGLSLYSASSGSTNVPSATTSGSMLQVQNFATNSAQAAWKIWASTANDNELYFRTGAGASAWNTWQRFASKEWVATQVNNGTLTLATTGIATGSASFTANQATGSAFTVNVPGTNIGSSVSGGVISLTSSTGSGSSINVISDIGATNFPYQRLYTDTTIRPNTLYADSTAGQRTVDDLPSSLYGGMTLAFKNTSALPGVGGSTYTTLLSFAPYTDATGMTAGGQLAFSSSGVYHRKNAGSTGSTWATEGFKKLAYSGEATLQNVTDAGASTTNEVQFSNTVFFPGSGAQFFAIGTGDGATYSTYNMKVHGHWGWAFEDNTNTIRGVLDFRTGTLDMQGGFVTAGNLKAGALAGSSARVVLAGSDGTLSTTSAASDGLVFQRLSSTSYGFNRINGDSVFDLSLPLSKLSIAGATSLVGNPSSSAANHTDIGLDASLKFSGTSLAVANSLKVYTRTYGTAITIPAGTTVSFSLTSVGGIGPGEYLQAYTPLPYIDKRIMVTAKCSTAGTIDVFVHSMETSSLTIAAGQTWKFTSLIEA